MKEVGVDWTTFKSLVSTKDLSMQYVDTGGSYFIFAIEYNISWETTVLKDGGANQTDFETNYKPTANQPIGSRPTDTDSVTDIYTSVGVGTPVPTALSFDQYALQVQVVGTPTLTLWNVVLEGSLDGVNFSTILISTNLIGQGVIWGSAMIAPSLYIRSRVVSLTLGLATNITVTILGQT